MPKQRRYVEIEMEVECDEEGMVDEAWYDVNRLESLYDVMPGVVTRIGMPKKESRSVLTDTLAFHKITVLYK